MKGILITVIAALFLLSSCGNSPKEDEQKRKEAERKADSAALKVAVMPTLDCLPLFIAQEKGLFKKQNVDVRLQFCQAQIDQDTSLLRGHVEGIVTDLVRAEYMQRHDKLPLHYLTSTTASWLLLANKKADIKTIQQLDNKMIAMTRFSATDLLSDLVREEAALDTGRVFKIQINDLSIRQGMLNTGIMDAMFLPEPLATEARMSGHSVLFDTHVSDIWLGVIAFRQSLLNDARRQQQLEAFTKAYNEACDSIGKYGMKSYQDILTTYCGIPQKRALVLPGDLRFEHVKSPRTADLERARIWLNNNLKQNHER